MTTSNFQPESRGTLFRIRHVTQGSHTLIAARHLVPQGVFHIYNLFTLVWISWWVHESHFLLWFNFFSYSLNSKWIKLHHYKPHEMTESAYWPDTSRVGVINKYREKVLHSYVSGKTVPCTSATLLYLRMQSLWEAIYFQYTPVSRVKLRLHHNLTINALIWRSGTASRPPPTEGLGMFWCAQQCLYLYE